MLVGQAVRWKIRDDVVPYLLGFVMYELRLAAGAEVFPQDPLGPPAVISGTNHNAINAIHVTEAERMPNLVNRYILKREIRQSIPIFGPGSAICGKPASVHAGRCAQVSGIPD